MRLKSILTAQIVIAVLTVLAYAVDGEEYSGMANAHSLTIGKHVCRSSRLGCVVHKTYYADNHIDSTPGGLLDPGCFTYS